MKSLKALNWQVT